MGGFVESKNVLRLIRYHWAAIVACVALGLAAGWAASAFTPREYTAQAEVFVTARTGDNAGELAQTSNFSQLQARNFSAVATREIVLSPVIEELALEMTPRELRRQVSTSVPLNTSMISITASDGSPGRAAAIANTVASTLARVVPTLTPQVAGDSPVRVQVIESAVAPRSPSSPNVPLLVLMGLLGGLVTAAAFVVLRGFVDARVRSDDQLTEITGLPLLGTVAFERRANRHPLAFDDPRSLRIEDFRQIRANLRFLQTDSEHKLFVVTSSIPGEGKSCTSANIAAALAASGLSTCLVEADLRRPSLGGVFDLPQAIGFTDVLAGQVQLEDALQTWGDDGLQVLLAGDIPPNPSELLESVRAGETFARIRERFDVTIVDCPPLNPVSDAAVVARELGGVIVVAGAGVLRVRELRRALERLAAVGASIEGTILNLARGGGRTRYDYRPTTQKGRSRRRLFGSAPAAPVTGSPDRLPPTPDAPATRDDGDLRVGAGRARREGT